MMHTLPPALGGMTSYAQFMIYKLVPSQKRPGKTDKFPCYINGDVTDAHNSSAWVTADVACAEASRRGEGWGVAFVLTENDPFFFFDIDDCLKDGKWNDISTELCRMFAGAAVEVSQSGRGLHILGTGKPSVETDKRYKKANIIVDGKKVNLFDLYTEARFIALTGNAIVGDINTSHTQNLDVIVNRYLLKPDNVADDAGWTDTHVEGSYPIEDDVKLIEKACSSKGGVGAIFGGKATFKDLWTRNVEVLSDMFPPDQGGDGYDESEADLALASHLSFWCGGNCSRMERLMRQSALMRKKWEDRPAYLRETIMLANRGRTTYYSVGAPIELVTPAQVIETGSPVIRSGYQFIGGSQLVDHFKGCVYVADSHRILTPNGQMLKSEQFNAMYGGYVFALDDGNEKTTKKAFEAFTENQCIMFPKVDRSTFRPDLSQGAIIEEDGLRHVNVYVPVTVASAPGDVTPFLTHLAKLLPVERDRDILLSYMAACVQYKGVKFKWAPLLQGVEGNGKTLFTLCVMEAVGSRYSHMPPAQEIGEKFNAWLFDKIFIGVEDIYVPEQKLELIETLKPMITGEYLAKRAMQQDQVMHRLCANFMFNSNHKNAVRKTANDRRFAIFYTAQQEHIDIVRDGMGGDYFPNLYDWLKRGGGFAAVTHYLENYAIPAQFNPATHCQRAPETSSTHEAVTASLGSVEQEIMEAIDEGRQGFAGGWVSSKALDNLLRQMRADRTVPVGKRRDMMRQLGYDWHPALKDGRVNNVIMIDGGKPRLYIKIGHIHANLTNAADVARHYAAAQGDTSALAFAETK